MSENTQPSSDQTPPSTPSQPLTSPETSTPASPVAAPSSSSTPPPSSTPPVTNGTPATADPLKPKKKGGMSPYLIALILFVVGIGIGYVLIKQFPGAKPAEKVMQTEPTAVPTVMVSPTVEPSPASGSAMMEKDSSKSGEKTGTTGEKVSPTEAVMSPASSQ